MGFTSGEVLVENEKIGGDILWPVVPHIFIPWMEAIIGCPIYSGGSSFYAEPFIDKWEDFTWEVDLSGDNGWLEKLLELQSALIDHFGGSYPTGSSSHLRGPVDMISLALGQTRFCLELYDNPDKIKKMSLLYTDAFIKVARMQNQLASKSEFGGYTVNAYGTWSPYICQYFQDDAIVFLSPNLYKDFFLKGHIKITESFDSTLFHLHPVSLFIVDELVKMERLSIIEVNRDINSVSIKELINTFKKIQESGKALLIDFTPGSASLQMMEEEIKIICDSLTFKGLGIRIFADDHEDALLKMNTVRKVVKNF